MENYEKKYKEALEWIHSIYPTMQGADKEDAEHYFPELKESEDEKWRNWLIGHLKGYINQTDDKYAEVCKKAIAWLEKQGEKQDTVTPQWMIDFLEDHRRHFGTPMDYDEKQETDGKMLAVIKWLEGNPQLEQKPAWSEEDEQMIQDIIEAMQDIIEAIGTQYDVSDYKEMVDWLKSLKDRVQLQPKQEWSEEDEKMLNGIIEEIRPFGECPDYPTDEDKEYYYGRTKMIDWLKSLKPQNRWKPSEEQMSMLLAVLNDSNNITAESVHIALKSLYNNLKKL